MFVCITLHAVKQIIAISIHKMNDKNAQLKSFKSSTNDHFTYLCRYLYHSFYKNPDICMTTVSKVYTLKPRLHNKTSFINMFHHFFCFIELVWLHDTS